MLSLSSCSKDNNALSGWYVCDPVTIERSGEQFTNAYHFISGNSCEFCVLYDWYEDGYQTINFFGKEWWYRPPHTLSYIVDSDGLIYISDGEILFKQDNILINEDGVVFYKK